MTTDNELIYKFFEFFIYIIFGMGLIAFGWWGAKQIFSIFK